MLTRDSIDTTRDRPIRSFVARQGRQSPTHEKIVSELWPIYGLSLHDKLDVIKTFGRIAPLTLEIGFGNGQSLLSLARAHPEQDFIGIEVYQVGIAQLLGGIREYGLKNVRVYCADVVEVLSNCLHDSSLHRVQLFFPDPWPKVKHHKRRIVQLDFAKLIASKVEDYGYFHLATDWQNYAEQMLQVLEDSPYWDNLAGCTNYSVRPMTRIVTKFERRGQKLGHGVWDLIFRKRHTSRII